MVTEAFQKFMRTCVEAEAVKFLGVGGEKRGVEAGGNKLRERVGLVRLREHARRDLNAT